MTNDEMQEGVMKYGVVADNLRPLTYATIQASVDKDFNGDRAAYIAALGEIEDELAGIIDAKCGGTMRDRRLGMVALMGIVCQVYVANTDFIPSEETK
jgi:hypothetical protein